MTLSPIDVANAYGAFVDRGQAKDVYLIESVRTADGERRYRHHVKTRQVISPEVAADTTYALHEVTQVGTGTNANVIGRPIAGKTGTATDDAGHVRSSWFVGYTPQLVTAVMYSRGNGNEPLDGYLDSFFGGTHPAMTWAAVMSRALDGEPVVDLPPPAFLTQTVQGHEPTPTYSPTPTPTKTKSASPKPGPKPGGKPSPGPKPSGGGGGGGGQPSPTASPTTQSPPPQNQQPQQEPAPQ
jgi:membrane peptidoglycan carboxypeptidase